MTRKNLLTLIGSVCLTLMLCALPFMAACGPEEVTPIPPEEEKPTPIPPEEEKPTPTPTEVKPPEVVSVIGYNVGASATIMNGFFGDAMQRKFGTKLRAIPCGTDAGRFIATRSGDVDYASQGGAIYFAKEGLDIYADTSWGPQRFRMLWATKMNGNTTWCRADSDIYTLADLKGKKVPWIPGSIMNLHLQAHLAYAGLTFEDVELVTLPTYVAGLKAVLEGTVDACNGAPTSSQPYELAASPHGIRYLEMPITDKEASWARAKKVCPYFVPQKTIFGAEISEENPIECATFGYPVAIAYPNLDEDRAYFITKAYNECYDLFAPNSELMAAYWGLDQCLSLYEGADIYIWHPGSVRYLKDIGAWKPEYDKLQQERLNYEKELLSLWNDVLARAAEEGISVKDFPPYWLEKRAEVFGR